MRTHVERPVRVWIAGISICLLAASGTVAIVRSIPASYASIPDERAPLRPGAASRGAEETFAKDPPADLASAAGTINRRSRARCPECGVVESMRQVKPSADIKVAGGVSGNPIVASTTTTKDYEMTVRFRDGSTTVFNEANPRTWRLGSRVMVIGRSVASNN
jgi:hypothetical protein